LSVGADGADGQRLRGEQKLQHPGNVGPLARRPIESGKQGFGRLPRPGVNFIKSK
jgi:hypothetical protein